MLKDRRQARRSCSSKCRQETIRCRWTLLLKLSRGFENQSKNRKHWNGATRLVLRPRSPEIELNSSSGCGSRVRFGRYEVTYQIGHVKQPPLSFKATRIVKSLNSIQWINFRWHSWEVPEHEGVRVDLWESLAGIDQGYAIKQID
jgi:hypothetical protein